MGDVTIWLLRHAKVGSHRGDQPLTEDAFAPIAAAADVVCCSIEEGDTVSFHSTKTKRSQQTADALRDNIGLNSNKALPTWGLRNPDLYLFGTRVEMVSAAEAFVDQVDIFDVGPDDVKKVGFYREFLSASDRIEYWLTHENPPGESATEVAMRVINFAKSLSHLQEMHHHAICVTHSPVMRAVLTKGFGIEDQGEPDWVEAIEISLSEGSISARYRAASKACSLS